MIRPRGPQMSYRKITMQNKPLRTLKYEEHRTSRQDVEGPAYYELHSDGAIEGCFPTTTT